MKYVWLFSAGSFLSESRVQFRRVRLCLTALDILESFPGLWPGFQLVLRLARQGSTRTGGLLFRTNGSI